MLNVKLVMVVLSHLRSNNEMSADFMQQIVIFMCFLQGAIPVI